VPVAIAASNIAANSFTANWNSVTGASSYRLDVSSSSTFISPTPSTIENWSFPSTSADATVDVASSANVAKTITTGGGTGTLAFNSQGAGGSGDFCASANTWTNGSGTKYWQIDFDATGFYGLTISSKQISSNTGPKDF
jgi:hypothetical protein